MVQRTELSMLIHRATWGSTARPRLVTSTHTNMRIHAECLIAIQEALHVGDGGLNIDFKQLPPLLNF